MFPRWFGVRTKGHVLAKIILKGDVLMSAQLKKRVLTGKHALFAVQTSIVFSMLLLFLSAKAASEEKQELRVEITCEGKALAWTTDDGAGDSWSTWSVVAHIPSKKRGEPVCLFRCSNDAAVLESPSLPLTVVVSRHFHLGIAPERTPTMSWAFRVVEMKTGKMTVKLDFLKPVHGRVVGSDGQPAAGVQVIAQLEESFCDLQDGVEDLKNTHWLKTDADGQYEMDALLPGRYKIDVLNEIGGEITEVFVLRQYYRANNRNYLPGKSVEFEAKPGMSDKLPDAPVFWCDLPVRIQLTRDGKPVPKAVVRTEFRDAENNLPGPGHFRLSSTTDKNGQCELLLPRVSGKLSPIVLECPPVGKLVQNEEFQIRGDEKEFQIECAVPSNLAAIRVVCPAFPELPKIWKEHDVEWRLSLDAVAGDNDKGRFSSSVDVPAAPSVEMDRLLPGNYRLRLTGLIVADPPAKAGEEYWVMRDRLFQELNDRFMTDVTVGLKEGDDVSVVLRIRAQ